MAQTIITQNRTIINFEKLLAVFVDPDYDDNENIVGFSLVGVTDMDEKKDSILLGSYEPYKIKVFNTIDFAKSMHYNPFAYLLKIMACLIGIFATPRR